MPLTTMLSHIRASDCDKVSNQVVHAPGVRAEHAGKDQSVPRQSSRCIRLHQLLHQNTSPVTTRCLAMRIREWSHGRHGRPGARRHANPVGGQRASRHSQCLPSGKLGPACLKPHDDIAVSATCKHQHTIHHVNTHGRHPRRRQGGAETVPFPEEQGQCGHQR